jgi:hypothetical protein
MTPDWASGGDQKKDEPRSHKEHREEKSKYKIETF